RPRGRAARGHRAGRPAARRRPGAAAAAPRRPLRRVGHPTQAAREHPARPPRPSREPMQTAEIRRRFLEHFAERGHTVVPSASMVSPDPSLLFTVAGMVPFIPYLTGRAPAPYPR